MYIILSMSTVTSSESAAVARPASFYSADGYCAADSVGYLSLEGLLSAVNSERRSYCTSCYTGVYPVAFARNEQAYLQLALKSID